MIKSSQCRFLALKYPLQILELTNIHKLIKNAIPISGLWSGVKLSGPQTVDRIPVVAKVGHLLTALSI